MNFIWVFIGGGLGSCIRYGIARLLTTLTADYPLATLLTNLMACAVLGYGMSLLLTDRLPDPYKLLLLTGFCGGFSTFSTFSAEVFELYNNGQLGVALAYVLLSIIGGFLTIAYFLQK